MLFLLAAIGMGLLISAVSATMQQSMLYSMLLIMPFSLLSGPHDTHQQHAAMGSVPHLHQPAELRDRYYPASLLGGRGSRAIDRGSLASCAHRPAHLGRGSVDFRQAIAVIP